MTIAVIVSLFLSVIAVWVVLSPLFGEISTEADVVNHVLLEKEAVLTALADLEDDYLQAKIEHDEYLRIKAELQQRAAQLISALGNRSGS